MTARLYQFKGSDADYISFLERTLVETSIYFCTNGVADPPSDPLPITTTASGVSADLLPARPALGNQKGETQPGLQIVQYDPSRVASRPCATPRWQQELDRLLVEIPDVDSWETRRAKVNLKDNRKVIRMLLNDCASSEDMSLASGSESHSISILDSLRSYALFTKEKNTEATFSAKLSLFQELVFVSFCAVALKAGVSKDAILSALRLYISDSGEEHLMKIISGATWANQCISSLSNTAWGSKSSEIFFASELRRLPMAEPNSLTNLSRWTNSQLLRTICSLWKGQLSILYGTSDGIQEQNFRDRLKWTDTDLYPLYHQDFGW